MRQCKFCGTFNDPSLPQCTTCDTSLDAQAQPYASGHAGGGDHTLNTRPLAPSAQQHQANLQQAGIGPYQSVDPSATAQFGVSSAQHGQAAHNQTSPHNSTDNYNVPPYLTGGGPMMTAPSVSAAPDFDATAKHPAVSQPAAVPHAVSAPPSSPALDAFESAPDQSPPVQPDNPYQVDFGGFQGHSDAGMSGKMTSVMVFLGLCCLGILAFFVYLFFADPSDDDKTMAAKRKGPDLTTPVGKTKHLLGLAKVDIAQQRWGKAKGNIDEAIGMAPNQELRDEANALKSRLTKEKGASDWFAQALKYDKKGDFGSAYMALQKIDKSTKLHARAGLLLKRIRTQRLPQAARLASRYARKKRTYRKAYLSLLRIERVDPKFKGLRRAKRKVKRKLKRYMYKKKRRCRRSCRRRYRGRRRRAKKKACYGRCGERYALPVLKPISLTPPKPTKITNRPPPLRRVCCARSTSRYTSCLARCYKRRRRYCYRRARRKYRRSSRRRRRYIRRYCTKRKLIRYCQRSRRGCRGRYRSLKRCKRRCK